MSQDTTNTSNPTDNTQIELTKSIVAADALALLPPDVREKIENLQVLMQGQKVGFEDDGAEFRPAFVKLVQPVTTDPAKPDNAKTGDYFHKGGLVGRPIRGVVAYSYVTRVRFEQGVDKRPSCSSENVDGNGRGKTDRSVSIYGDKCSQCPFGDQPFTAGKQTSCNNVWNVIFVPESLENVFQFTFSKASYQTGRQLVDLARATPLPWSRFYELNSEIKKRDKGNGIYAVPTVTPVSNPDVPLYLKSAAEYICAWMGEIRREQKSRIEERATDAKAVLDTLEIPKSGTTADYADKF